MKKIVFLDVDGVLNSEEFFKNTDRTVEKETSSNFDYYSEIYKDMNKEYEYMISMVDPEKVKLLEQAYQIIGFDVVISSTWRVCHYDHLIAILNEFGFTGTVIDKTPSINYDSSVRGNEILQWMRCNVQWVGQYGKYHDYAILDDSDDILYWHRNNFVHTSWKTGLIQSDIYKLIEIFNRSNSYGNS